ncbi:hypothetical protein [Pseudomonas phoenicis]|uniref:hypothetical protein n=1 Tax=unclassified Pseudomonas TaxID=196821 RepID=UPI0039A2CCB4
MRLSKNILVLLTLSALAGCGEQLVESCPDAGRAFIEDSVRTYFANTYPPIDGASLDIASDEYYEPAAKIWSVSANTPDKDYFALVSCNGCVELSGKTLRALQAPKS